MLIVKMNDNEIRLYEYDVTKLNNIHEYLWIAGRLNHINPLHKQLCMRRDIIIVEDISLHLVWYDNIIYIKPLPKIFIDKYIDDDLLNDENIIGFLKTYIKLIKTKSDYYIAIEKRIIENDLEWESWKYFYNKFKEDLNYNNISKRYDYGELRLHRLNLIYRLTFRNLFYFNIYRQYDKYFGKYFQISIILFAYLSIFLTAMQVILASTSDIYYNFGIFSIIIALLSIFLTIIIFLFVFFYNLIITLTRQKYH